jgi:hypothetical protein
MVVASQAFDIPDENLLKAKVVLIQLSAYRLFASK